jgi:hypothetical protein
MTNAEIILSVLVAVLFIGQHGLRKRCDSLKKQLRQISEAGKATFMFANVTGTNVQTLAKSVEELAKLTLNLVKDNHAPIKDSPDNIA